MGHFCSSSKTTGQVPSLHLSHRQIEDYHQLTNLSPSEIRMHHRQFLQVSPTGRMTLKQFEEQLRTTTSSINGSRAMFKMIDKDHSGEISFEEYLLSTVMFSQQCQPEQQLGAVFDTYQALARHSLKETHPQGMTRNDIEYLLERMHPELSKEELKQLTNRYMETDQNQNGFISKQEFIAACMKNVQLMEQLGYRDAVIRDETKELE